MNYVCEELRLFFDLGPHFCYLGAVPLLHHALLVCDDENYDANFCDYYCAVDLIHESDELSKCLELTTFF